MQRITEQGTLCHSEKSILVPVFTDYRSNEASVIVHQLINGKARDQGHW